MGLEKSLRFLAELLNTSRAFARGFSGAMRSFGMRLGLWLLSLGMVVIILPHGSRA